MFLEIPVFVYFYFHFNINNYFISLYVPCRKYVSLLKAKVSTIYFGYISDIHCCL